MHPNTRFYETMARFYDAENRDMTDDLLLYGALADETGGPVLDVGCGTGRVTLHLAQAGCRVVGVDSSAEMLARARRKLDVLPDLRPQVTFVHGDALTVDLAGGFRLAVVAYNTFLQFNTQRDQLALLRRLSGLMVGGGSLVMDLPNAGEIYATQDDSALALERTFVEPETGHVVMQQSVSALDRAAQLFTITWIYDEMAADGTLRRTVAPLALRLVFPGEIELMLAAAGFRLTDLYSEYDGTPFADGSPRMIVLAEKLP